MKMTGMAECNGKLPFGDKFVALTNTVLWKIHERIANH